MTDFGMMPGRYPAVVREYLPERRTCRVEVPGLTDGGDVLPEAEIEYPIGDKAKAGEHGTEIEIVPGDTVWIAFIGGDPRYPIITGWRNPQTGNDVDWRRWHHANMELLADTLMNMIAGSDMLLQSGTKITIVAPEVIANCETATVNASSSTTIDTPETTITGNLTVGGNVAMNGGSVTHGGVNIGKAHKHTQVMGGTATSGPPQP
ncbi:MAG TPA: hypothetical protein VIG97_02345 [Luteimonas sp.]